MIPIRTIEEAKPLRGLAKAYEDGLRDGRAQGMELALTIVKDHIEALGPLLRSWGKELNKDKVAGPVPNN